MGVIVGGNSPTLYVDEFELEQLKSVCFDPEEPDISVYDELDRILKAIEVVLEPLQGAFNELSKGCAAMLLGVHRLADVLFDEIGEAIEAVFAKKPAPRPPHLLCPFRTTLRFARRRLLRLIYGQGVDVGGNL